MDNDPLLSKHRRISVPPAATCDIRSSKSPDIFDVPERYAGSYSYGRSADCFPGTSTLITWAPTPMDAEISKENTRLVLAVLEVEGPDTIRTKKGPDAGKEISILKMILGDEDGSVCRLTAWREIADVWGGSGPKDVGAKRGDVVLIESL